MDVLAVRNALARQVSESDFPHRVVAGNRDSVEVPCLIVPTPTVEYDATAQDTSHMLTFTLRFLAGRAAETVAEERVAAVISDAGACSVKAAVESDMSLGDAVSWARVARAERIGVYTYGQIDYLGCELVVEVQQ